MANALAHSPDRTKYDLSSLKVITIGGAASSPTLVKDVEEKLGCTCVSGYGLTETSPAIAFSPMKAGTNWEGEQRYKGQAMTGFAIPGAEIRAIDGAGNDVPHDGKTIGEVAVRSDGLMKGYWGRPELTESTMRGNWFCTGDVATIDENNYILIVDRKKDIIVSGGENISSLEVEKVLASHPGVFEVTIIPVPDDRWGDVPKALVVLKTGSRVQESDLLDFCRSHLSHYKCPHSVEFLDRLPKTGSGKILKKELRDKYAAQKTVQ
jgi:fatty-acyl-CoA synthase